MNKTLRSQSGFILPILVIVTIIMLAVAGYLYLKSPEIDKPEFVRQLEEKVNKNIPDINIDDSIQAPAEVAITKDGFMPSTITVMAGQQIIFVNQDKSAHRVIPYLASRNSLPELDSEDLQPTDSFTYSFEKIGTFTLSDSINLGKYKATVIVN